MSKYHYSESTGELSLEFAADEVTAPVVTGIKQEQPVINGTVTPSGYDKLFPQGFPRHNAPAKQ